MSVVDTECDQIFSTKLVALGRCGVDIRSLDNELGTLDV